MKKDAMKHSMVSSLPSPLSIDDIDESSSTSQRCGSDCWLESLLVEPAELLSQAMLLALVELRLLAELLSLLYRG